MTLAAGSQCSVGVYVTGSTPGTKLNTTDAVTSTNGGTGLTASASLSVFAPPSISKSFGAASILLNGSTTLSFTITNPAGNPAPLTGIGFTDSLPAGLVVSTPPNLTGACGGGSISATGGSGSVSLSGASLTSGQTCNFEVNVTGTASGVKSNSVTVNSTEGGQGNTSSANLTVQQTVQISVGTNPSGLSFSVDSTPYTNAQAFTWVVGESHTLATASPQAGTSGTRYVFSSWSDSPSVSHTVIVPGTATTYTANFTTQYELAIAVNPPAGGTVSPPSGFQSGGIPPVSLTAAPAAGYIFAGWTSNSGPDTVADAGNPSTTITMSAPDSVTANFALLQQAPAFTSANSATFAANQPGTFTVTTTGIPATGITESGDLPNGITFIDKHDGTGTLAGTPTQAGTFPITFAASNGVGAPAQQNFTLRVTSPVPFIDIVQPSAATPGGNISQLTISGANFVGGATVDFNGTSFTPASVSGNQIVVNDVSAPASGVTVAVTVVNPNTSPLLGISNVAFLPVTTATPSVNASRTDFDTGTAPFAVAVGDFNSDGKLDLAVANQLSDTLTILLGDGSGSFAATASSPDTGTTPSSVAVGDFNGDGKLDLAAANLYGNTLSILLGEGDGTFVPASSPNTGNLPLSVAAGDFNSDGRLDLAVSNLNDNTVSILLGHGDGTFTLATAPHTGNYPYSVAVGDFNGDGRLDLAVANFKGNTVTILLGDGTGSFTATSSSPATGNKPGSVAVGDFNGDGKQDLAVANFNGNTVTILLGDGGGNFTATASSPPTGNFPRSVAAGDFNGDGKLDLVVANDTDRTVTILLGDGGGRFAATASSPSTGNNPYSVAVGDFDGNGRLDFAVAHSGSSVSVLLQAPVAAAGPQTGLNFGSQPINTPSNPMQATLTNNGSVPLVVTSVSASSGYGSTTNCLGTLQPGAQCAEAITFSPTAMGPTSGAVLTFTDNDNNVASSTQTVPLNGIGLATPTVAFTGAPASAVYGSTFVVSATTNASTTAVITASGACSASGNTVTITSGTGMCSLVADWAADSNFTSASRSQNTAAGRADSATSITANTPNPSLAGQLVTVSFKVSGVTVPTGGVLVTASTLESCSGTLNEGAGSCEITFVAAGPRPLTAVYSGDGNFNGSSSASVSQTVNSSTVLVFSPSSVNFGTVTLWGGTKQVLTVTNTGATTVKFTKISLSALVGVTAKDLTYNAGCGNQLAAGKSCKITLSLWPSKVGSVSAILNVQNNAPGSPQMAAITATVIAPKANVSPSSLSFGSQTVNSTSVAKTVTLSNPGVGTLTISGITIAGSNSTDFLLTGNTCGSSLAQGSGCTISLSFKPKARGSRSAALKIMDNAQSGTQAVSLSGKGN